jgi:hypothetical protein
MAVDPLERILEESGEARASHQQRVDAASAAPDHQLHRIGSGLEGGSSASPIEERIIRGKPLQVPAVRHPRTVAEMCAEAATYRVLFPDRQWDTTGDD